jgi:hypothetical protein
MTEEVVSGRDFDDMLASGHLLDVEDAHAAGRHTLFDDDWAMSSTPSPTGEHQQLCVNTHTNHWYGTRLLMMTGLFLVLLH